MAAKTKSTPNAPVAISNADALAEVHRWYDATADALIRAWEQRFRHRQYRAWEDNDGEENAPPLFEIEHAIDAQPFMQTPASMYLVLAAVAPGIGNHDDPAPVNASSAMAQDLLARAERLGYFAEACTEALRFPDLPEAPRDMRDDLEIAEQEEAAARSLVETLRVFAEDDEYRREKMPEAEARLKTASERLAGMKAGTISVLTRAEKEARHNEARERIVLAYKARLEAAGHDASWVEVAPHPFAPEESEEVRP